jgi:mRNA interferase MazF
MKRGEIWLINLDPTIGSEIRKTRPAVIVNSNALGKLPLSIIVPIADWKENYAIAPWMIHLKPEDINGLSKPSAADCFQVRSVSHSRFVKKLGILNAALMQEIKNGLTSVMELN